MLTDRLDDLGGIFQSQWFHDSTFWDLAGHWFQPFVLQILLCPLSELRKFHLTTSYGLVCGLFFTVSIRRFFQNPVVLMTGNPLLSFQASLFMERLYHWFFVSSFCFNSSCSIFDVYPHTVLESCHTHFFFIRTNWMVLREWYDLRNGRESICGWGLSFLGKIYLCLLFWSLSFRQKLSNYCPELYFRYWQSYIHVKI